MFFNKPSHYLILAWCLVITIIILSLIPGNSLAKYNLLDFLAIDKFGHFMFYGLTAWSFLKSFTLKNQFTNLWKIGIALLLLGISLEILQYFLHKGRSFDLFDVLANGIGIYCGLRYFDFVISFIIKRYPKNKME